MTLISEHLASKISHLAHEVPSKVSYSISLPSNSRSFHFKIWGIPWNVITFSVMTWMGLIPSSLHLSLVRWLSPGLNSTSLPRMKLLFFKKNENRSPNHEIHFKVALSIIEISYKVGIIWFCLQRQVKFAVWTKWCFPIRFFYVLQGGRLLKNYTLLPIAFHF